MNKNENFDQNYIEKILSDQKEESVYLEFKAAGSLEKLDRNKTDISKDISAFANSDGGVIIYGIKEIDHKANALDFIDGRKISKEWLENVIDSNIKRRIPDLRIIPIRFNSQIEKTIYVVDIPSSSTSPHMANDNRYYRRANYKIIPMEEYEIRNQYNRASLTKLTFDSIIIKQNGSSSSGSKLTSIHYQFHIQIKNIGTTIEKDYKVEIQLPELIYATNRLSGALDKYFLRTEDNFALFSIPNSSPIFQEETTTLITFNLIFSRSNFSFIIENGIKLRLYYTSGIEDLKLDMSGKLEYNKRQLQLNDFE